MITSYSHTGITVRDLDRSVAFYVDILGLGVGRRWERVGPEIEALTEVEDAHLKMASVTKGDFMLEIIQYVGGAGEGIDPAANNAGIGHIAFTVDDVDAFSDELKQKGVRFYGAPSTLPPPGLLESGLPVRGVYFADPDGITIEIVGPGR